MITYAGANFETALSHRRHAQGRRGHFIEIS
jgi:hypothetical protein